MERWKGSSHTPEELGAKQEVNSRVGGVSWTFSCTQQDFSVPEAVVEGRIFSTRAAAAFPASQTSNWIHVNPTVLLLSVGIS